MRSFGLPWQLGLHSFTIGYLAFVQPLPCWPPWLFSASFAQVRSFLFRHIHGDAATRPAFATRSASLTFARISFPAIPNILNALHKAFPRKPQQPISTNHVFQPFAMHFSNKSVYFSLLRSCASFIPSSHGTVNSKSEHIRLPLEKSTMSGQSLVVAISAGNYSWYLMSSSSCQSSVISNMPPAWSFPELLGCLLPVVVLALRNWMNLGAFFFGFLFWALSIAAANVSSTWSWGQLYFPLASDRAQELRMCSTVTLFTHSGHDGSSVTFQMARFVGDESTLQTEAIENFSL